jgi:S-adenosyl-L-methionine hydrolase (adenosine-forming)
MPRPIIALLTDFGLRDHYVAAMKAVALGICPDVTFVDITHEIAPQDVAGAALELEACYGYFPAGTIFLVVVDPGVGSQRRAIAVSAGPYRFVAPDNGVLTAAVQHAGDRRVVELTDPKYARPTMSRTFEGRDRFAPAAAWLATGTDLGSLGSPVDDMIELLLPEPERTGDRLSGEVLRVDRFGNLVTNIDRARLEAFLEGGDGLVGIAGRTVPIVETYADVPAGSLCALVSSSDSLEIAVTGGSATWELSATRGAAVHVRKRA